MSEDKGYLTESGRVVTRSFSSLDPGLIRKGLRFSADGEEIVGRVSYSETRYNLRRVLVTRSWKVSEFPDGSVQAGGSTRREAIEAFFAALAEQRRRRNTPRVISEADAVRCTVGDLRVGDAVYDGCFLYGFVSKIRTDDWGTVHFRCDGQAVGRSSRADHPAIRYVRPEEVKPLG